MLLSKKLPGIRLIPVELEIGRQPPAKGPQPVQEILSLWLASDAECALAGHMHVNLITRLKLQRFDNGRRKADRKAVAPFGDLHDALPRIDIKSIVYLSKTTVKNAPRSARGQPKNDRYPTGLRLVAVREPSSDAG